MIKHLVTALSNNYDLLLATISEVDLLDKLWPLIVLQIDNKILKKCNTPDALRYTAIGWVEGVAFRVLFQNLDESGAKQIWGERFRKYKIEDVVGFCEGGLSYDCSLIIGAVSQILDSYISTQAAQSEEEIDTSRADLWRRASSLQRILKYGLPSKEAICLYEMGFADRTIAMRMTSILGEFGDLRESAIANMEYHRDTMRTLFADLPNYYQFVLRRYLHG